MLVTRFSTIGVWWLRYTRSKIAKIVFFGVVSDFTKTCLGKILLAMKDLLYIAKKRQAPSIKATTNSSEGFPQEIKVLFSIKDQRRLQNRF